MTACAGFQPMTSSLQTISVSHSGGSYDVHVGRGLLGSAGALMRGVGLAEQRIVTVTDTNVGPIHSRQFREGFTAAGLEPPQIVEVPAGEASKCLSRVEELCERFAAARLDRGSAVVALGGGVIGDLAAFAAAIYMRGIACVQVPTTIVSQVDSSVGGKTGVNLRAGKNLAGVFHQPRLVVADVATLETLPPREFREGFAEIVKHAAIRDREMLCALETLDLSSPGNLAALVARNVRIKAAIVGEDERETSGVRALLNFGHTLGHAIEAAGGYGRFFHGEAISIGMAAAVRLSVRRAGLKEDEALRLVALLRRFQLPVCLPPDVNTNTIYERMEADKKFASGRMRFVLTPRLGEAYVSDNVTREDVEGAIAQLRKA